MNVRICSLKGQLSPEFVLLSVCCLLFSFLFLFFSSPAASTSQQEQQIPSACQTDCWFNSKLVQGPPPLLLLLLHPHHGSTVFLLKALCCAHVSMGINFHFQDASIHTHAGNPVTVQFFLNVATSLFATHCVVSWIYIYLCGVSGLSEWAQHLMIARWGS